MSVYVSKTILPGWSTFPAEDQKSPMHFITHVKPVFLKSKDNHNRSTERLIEKLEKIIEEEVRVEPVPIIRSDMRLRAYLYNVETEQYR